MCKITIEPPLVDPLLDMCDVANLSTTNSKDRDAADIERQEEGCVEFPFPTTVPNADDEADDDERWLQASLSARQKKLLRVGRVWKSRVAPTLFVVLCLLPIVIHRGVRTYWTDFFSQTWYAPLMGIIACAIPSGGVPVAGGIVFLPVLTFLYNNTGVTINTHAAVAFAAATQSVGVGWFAPLGWLAKDPTVVMLWSFLLPIAPWGLAGLTTGVLLVPLHRPDEVLWAFTAFSILLAVWVANGLVTNTLGVSTQEPEADGEGDGNGDAVTFVEPAVRNSIIRQEERRRTVQKRNIRFTKKTYALYAAVAFVGGVGTAWIGIGIEKLMFFLLTSVHGVDVVAAGLSSIVLTGWLSTLAFAFHALCSPPSDDADYDTPGPHWQCAVKSEGVNPDGYVLGDVPYNLFLAVLPGILLGSMIGPKINATVGSRNVMKGFIFFLLLDSVYNIVHLTA